MFLSRRAALGSRPTIGSSPTMHSGRWIRALEMISFWRMPWLYASTSSSFQLVSSNTSSSSAMRRSTTSPSCPYNPATKRRNSAPVSLSYTNGRSGMKPSRIFAASGSLWTSSPPSSTRPCVGRRMPAIIRSVVVLPAPFGPGMIVVAAVEVQEPGDRPRRQPRRPGERDVQHGVLIAVAPLSLQHLQRAGDGARDFGLHMAGDPMREQLRGLCRVALALQDQARLRLDARVGALD